MAGLWFKVAADLPRHGKSLALAHRLEDKRAWAYVVAMWGWFCEQAGDGIRTGPNAASEIAGGAGYDGDPEHFCRQMVAVGFLDVIAEGFKVHDWEEWAGYHVEAQKRDRQRKADAVLRKSNGVPEEFHGNSNGSPTEVPGSSSGPLSTLSSSVVASGGGAGGGLAGSRDQQRARWAAAHPVCAALLETLKAGAPPVVLTPSRRSEVTEQIEAATQVLGYDRAAAVVRAEHALDPNSSIGWYVKALHAAASAPQKQEDSAPPPAPDAAFLARHPEAAAEWDGLAEAIRGQHSGPALRAQLEGALWMLRAKYEPEAAA